MKIYDLIIVGAGPAGLSAAIYAGRALLDTLIIEKYAYGGKVNDTADVINYPGLKKTSGRELALTLNEHAKNFSTNKFGYGTVEEIVKEKDIFKVSTSRKKDYFAKSVIIATGTEQKHLNIKGEEKFRANGVSYCATCDADYFIDDDIHVVGSGDLGLEEADYLSNFANSVTIIVEHEKYNLDGNKLAQQKVLENPKISFLWNSSLVEILGYEKIESLKLRNTITNTDYTVQSEGVFIFAGVRPNSLKFLNVEKDELGYIISDDKMHTNIEGLFVAGDVRKKDIRQIVTAANDGAIATIFAEKYIRKRGAK